MVRLFYRLPKYLVSSESLDYNHRAATQGTQPSRLSIEWGRIRCWLLLIVGFEQSFADRQKVRTPPVGHKAEETDTDKATRKRVQ